MLYKPIKLDVPEKYHEQIKTALQAGKKVSVKVSLQSLDGDGGNETLLLTDGQVRKLRKAKENGKKNATVRLCRRQVEKNKKHTGGFLGLLTGLMASALPAILAGVATSAVSSAISGNGLFLNRQNQTAQIQPVQGGGLYLSPHPSSAVRGEGLYLKHGEDIYGEKALLESPWVRDELPILKIL